MPETPPSHNQKPDWRDRFRLPTLRKRLATASLMPLRAGLNFNWSATQTWLQTRRNRLKPALVVALVVALIGLEIWHLWWGWPGASGPWERGRQNYASGHYTAALADLRQELQDHPTNSAAKLLLTQNLVALRQWPAATAYLTELLDANPNDPLTLYWVGRVQAGAGQAEAALTTWTVLLSRPDPATRAIWPHIQVALGELRYRQGQYAQAADLLYQALQRVADLEAAEQQRAFYLYGLLLARDLRIEDAQGPLQRAINLDIPGSQWDNVPLRANWQHTVEEARLVLTNLSAVGNERLVPAKRARLAYAYLVAEEYGAAEEQLLQVLRAAPTYAEARAYLGLVYWRTGRTERAFSTLNAALAATPANPLVRQVLAEVIIDHLPTLQTRQAQDSTSYRQEVERANTLLNSLVAEKPDDPTLQVTLARFSVARHEYGAAAQYFQAALSFNRARPVAGLNPGAAFSRYYSEFNFDSCVRGVDRGVEATKDLPFEAESWYAAGLAYSGCGYPDRAVTYLERAYELKPYRTDVIHRLALTYQSLGRRAEADRLFTLLADLDPAQVYYRPQ